MGPVQVLVVGVDHPNFSGLVLSEFARLREAGIVRLLDVLLVQRLEDGSFDTIAAPAELGTASGTLAAAVLGHPDGAAGATADNASGDAAEPSSWSLADVVPAGSVAAVALIEHIWAAPLLSAVQRSGGIPLGETWLAADDIATLDEIVAKRGG